MLESLIQTWNHLKIKDVHMGLRLGQVRLQSCTCRTRAA